MDILFCLTLLFVGHGSGSPVVDAEREIVVVDRVEINELYDFRSGKLQFTQIILWRYSPTMPDHYPFVVADWSLLKGDWRITTRAGKQVVTFRDCDNKTRHVSPRFRVSRSRSFIDPERTDRERVDQDDRVSYFE